MKWIGIKNNLLYEEVREVAKNLNIILPEDYCKKIGSINGGALKAGYYSDEKLGKIAYSRNINLDIDTKGNAIELYHVLNSGSKKYFPFGSVGNGDYYCFDISKQEVVLYVHETDTVYPLCRTFTELLEALYE